jgi:hypothetical protein
MNNKDQENGALRGPLIFTVPAYCFVMALYLDWLGRSNRAAFSDKTFAQEIKPGRARAIQAAGERPIKNLILSPSSLRARGKNGALPCLLGVRAVLECCLLRPLIEVPRRKPQQVVPGDCPAGPLRTFLGWIVPKGNSFCTKVR